MYIGVQESSGLGGSSPPGGGFGGLEEILQPPYKDMVEVAFKLFARIPFT